MASPHRQARWLAPLALIACAAAVYVVARSGGTDGSGTQPKTASAGRTADARASTAPTATVTRPARPRRYTIKPGDTLSAIAVKTGVPLETILELNPGLDSQTLQAGQTVKLAP